MSALTFDEYQEQALQTAIYPNDDKRLALLYLACGTAGEAGEIADCIKKYFRDGVHDYDKLAKEIGDCLWYLSMLCEEMGWNLGVVARQNADKLFSRKSRGVLGGSGDER